MSADASEGPLPPGGLNELVSRLSQPEFGHPVQATDDFCARHPCRVPSPAPQPDPKPRIPFPEPPARLTCMRVGAAAAAGERLRGETTVHVEFTGTRGGTSLGCEVDPALSELGGADTGEPILLVSKIKGLNGHPIRLHAKLDMRTLIGTAHVEVLPGRFVPAPR